MAGLSSLNMAVSGMWAAQGGISVVGHNIANIDTQGYSRQSIIQSDYSYLKISAGQVGYGTTVQTVRQIRNEFLDVRYRDEVTKATYYSAKVGAGTQIETLLGELQSEYTTESVIDDIWNAINELVTDPAALEARGNFVSTAITMVDKMTVIYDGLVDYQLTLNEDVKSQVSDINYYVSEINRLTLLINSNEVTGANANDYRDARNFAMDALSEICDVNYRIKADKSIDITLDGRSLLSNGMITTVGLRYTGPDCSYVEPVFTPSKKILKWDDVATPLYDLTKPVNTSANEDGGLLKGTLIARGLNAVNYTTLESLIPSSDFIIAGAPDPTDNKKYPLGTHDPAYQADAAAFRASLLENIVANLDFLPKAPIAPDVSDATLYPLGENDPQYVSDFNAYLEDVTAFNLDRKYNAPIAPVIPDEELYPLGASDPAYIADFAQYLTDIDTYNSDMQNIVKPTAPAVMNPVKPIASDYPSLTDPTYLADLKTYNDQMEELATYNLKLIQYKEDNAKYQNYLDKYDAFVKNNVEYDFRTNRQIVNCTSSTIPVMMQNLDQLFHDMVTLINDAVAPLDHNSSTAPSGLDEDSTQFMEIFTRKYEPYSNRYDADGAYYAEDPANPASLYSIKNVIINPELLNPSGFNQIALSPYENPSDNTIANYIANTWNEAICELPEPPGTDYEKLSISDAYNYLVTLNANATSEDKTFLEAQIVMVNSVENARLSVMGVSLDEEMANMLVYQKAYDAAARIVSEIDQMLDRLINGTGRVGL